MPTGPIVPDTSAWVEFLRATGSRAHERLAAAVESPAPLVVVGPVVMELLAGARNREERDLLQRMIAGCDRVEVAPADWEEAASVYRRLRDAGHTLRSQIDCLIAVVAMRIDAAVLHHDAGFDAIAAVAPLRIA